MSACRQSFEDATTECKVSHKQISPWSELTAVVWRTRAPPPVPQTGTTDTARASAERRADGRLWLTVTVAAAIINYVDNGKSREALRLIAASVHSSDDFAQSAMSGREAVCVSVGQGVRTLGVGGRCRSIRRRAYQATTTDLTVPIFRPCPLISPDLDVVRTLFGT